MGTFPSSANPLPLARHCKLLPLCFGDRRGKAIASRGIDRVSRHTRAPNSLPSCRSRQAVEGRLIAAAFLRLPGDLFDYQP
jgi:hypothetical protein